MSSVPPAFESLLQNLDAFDLPKVTEAFVAHLPAGWQLDALLWRPRSRWTVILVHDRHVLTVRALGLAEALTMAIDRAAAFRATHIHEWSNPNRRPPPLRPGMRLK